MTDTSVEGLKKDHGHSLFKQVMEKKLLADAISCRNRF